MERWRREEDLKKVQQSESESRQNLETIIQQWAYLKSVDQFLVGVEENSKNLPEKEKAACLTPDIPDNLFSRVFGTHQLLPHLRSLPLSTMSQKSSVTQSP